MYSFRQTWLSTNSSTCTYIFIKLTNTDLDRHSKWKFPIKLSTSVQLLSTVIRQSWINQTLITRIAFSNDMIEDETNLPICWFSILTTFYFCWAYPLSSKQVFSLFFFSWETAHPFLASTSLIGEIAHLRNNSSNTLHIGMYYVGILIIRA